MIEEFGLRLAEGQVETSPENMQANPHMPGMDSPEDVEDQDGVLFSPAGPFTGASGHPRAPLSAWVTATADFSARITRNTPASPIAPLAACWPTARGDLHGLLTPIPAFRSTRALDHARRADRLPMRRIIRENPKPVKNYFGRPPETPGARQIAHPPSR